MTQDNSQEGSDGLDVAGEGKDSAAAEMVTISKKDWETTQQTLGSLKRENKDFKKAQDSTKETPTKETKTDDSALLQKLERLSLRQAGIDHQDDIELARKTAKKWGVDIDDVLTDEDFKVKLEKQQTGRSNLAATADVKGGTGAASSKTDPAYWLAKGTPPPADMKLGFKDRAKIMRAFMAKERGSASGQFYNT